KETVIQNGMSESQTMKTGIHEVTHTKLHDRDVMEEMGEKKDKLTREVEAESSRRTYHSCCSKGSVKNFVALVKNGSFLVRIIDMTILIEKEFIYGSSKRPNPTDYYRKQHYQCG